MLGTTNSYAHPIKIRMPGEVDDRFQAIVTATTSALFDAKIANGQIEFIVNDEDIGTFDVIKLHTCNDTFTTQIHIRLRFEKDDRAPTLARCAKNTLKLRLAQRNPMLGTVSIDDHKTRIMTRTIVFRSGIAQTDD